MALEEFGFNALPTRDPAAGGNHEQRSQEGRQPRPCSRALHGARSPIELWQLHYAINAGKENNANDSFIANLEEVCEGKWIKLTAEKDGSFQVYNSRNKFEKNYPKK